MMIDRDTVMTIHFRYKRKDGTIRTTYQQTVYLFLQMPALQQQ